MLLQLLPPKVNWQIKESLVVFFDPIVT